MSHLKKLGDYHAIYTSLVNRSSYPNYHFISYIFALSFLYAVNDMDKIK